ncbi:hypothetical protein JX266_006116 [Neoarthrinium moseri]|nr:hypothetical protein JX266_006116 [Neoarthrinium moseri]
MFRAAGAGGGDAGGASGGGESDDTGSADCEGGVAIVWAGGSVSLLGDVLGVPCSSRSPKSGTDALWVTGSLAVCCGGDGDGDGDGDDVLCDVDSGRTRRRQAERLTNHLDLDLDLDLDWGPDVELELLGLLPLALALRPPSPSPWPGADADAIELGPQWLPAVAWAAFALAGAWLGLNADRPAGGSLSFFRKNRIFFSVQVHSYARDR